MLSGAASNIGEIHLELNEPNQDNYFINDDKRIYAVFDGHGIHGHVISSFLKNNLAATFADCLHPTSSVPDSLRNAFRNTNETICKSSKSLSSGSTCALAYIDDDTLYVAGVGDCCAMLVQVDSSTGNLRTTPLLPLHKLSNAPEFDRISKLGTNVSGDYLICKSDPNKVINMTRAFGDQDMLSAGVIALPEISVTKLPRTKQNSTPKNKRFSVEVGDADYVNINNNSGDGIKNNNCGGDEKHALYDSSDASDNDRYNGRNPLKLTDTSDSSDTEQSDNEHTNGATSDFTVLHNNSQQQRDAQNDTFHHHESCDQRIPHTQAISHNHNQQISHNNGQQIHNHDQHNPENPQQNNHNQHNTTNPPKPQQNQSDPSRDSQPSHTPQTTSRDASQAQDLQHTRDDVKYFDAELNPGYDTFLILASDGLDQVTNLEVAKQTHKLLKEQMTSALKPIELSSMCSDLLHQLEDSIYDRDGIGFNDDCTIIVTMLSGFSYT